MSSSGPGPRSEKHPVPAPRPALALVGEVEDGCDCLACSGREVDPEQVITVLLDGAAALADCQDPLEPEMAGALFATMVTAAGDDVAAAAGQALISAIEARGNEAALILLTSIGATAGGVAEQVVQAARAAAGRLADAGVPAPGWAGALAEPVRAGTFTRLYDAEGTMTVLAGTFQRAGYEHALVVSVDHEDCGAADTIVLLDGAHLPKALSDLRASGRQDGLTMRTEKVDASAFRWYVEQAMQARAVHDAEDGGGAGGGTLGFDDEDEGPGYATLAVLARVRLATLPQPRRPRGAVASAHANDRTSMDVLQQFSRLFAGSGGAPALGLGLGLPAPRRAEPAKLPPKRKKANGPAPAYQLKVGLHGAKPPIWRRLVVPGDITLARLHDAILAAFGWHGDHMHVFETPYGDFGRPDRDLGHRADTSATLEQVAPGEKSKLRYTYDFGDDWVHEILVEKVSPADPSAPPLRCTGGRRAAPPDDCGGIWGYEGLIEVLADPSHPEHQERLEWLGLADASAFTPAIFDVDEVNRRLSALR